MFFGAPRDHLLIVKNLRDVACTSDSKGPNHFILGGTRWIVRVCPGPLEVLVLTSEDIHFISTELLSSCYHKFTRITGQASPTSISRIIIYILYFIVKEQIIFNWGKLISIEICSQLSRFKESNKFYMSSYLIFAIVHCCPFPNLSLSKKINCEFDPVTFWY